MAGVKRGADSEPAGPAAGRRAVYRLFAETFRSHVAAYLVALGCMVAVAASTGGLAWLMRHVVNDVLVARNQQMMWVTAVAVLAIALVKGLADYGQTVLLTTIGNDIVATLQRRMFDKILTLGVDDFARSHSSKLIGRLITHATAARNVIARISTSVGRDLLTVIILAAVMIAQDVRMGLAVILIGPPAMLGLNRIVRQIRELAAREQKSMAGVVQSVQETVQGIRTVKSFTGEIAMRARFDQAARDAQTRSDSLVRIRARTSPLMEVLGGVLIAGLVVYSGWQTVAADKTAGEFMAFLVAFLLAYEPAKRLANAHVQLQRDIVGVEKMFEFLDRPETEPLADVRPDLKIGEGRIVFRGVRFGYERSKPVLDGVSFSADRGQMVALVGASGVGKSTIAALIQGFYSPWEGEIEIDGTPVSSVNRASLRRQIAVVSQDAAVFAGTIRQNIALGRPGATDAEVEAAAEAAHAMPFIRPLPNGLDTAIGERGSTLSGGQLQRLAIARAILKDAPILLLDEATSALDGETERHVQEALRNLAAGRTTIVIAHRRSTIEQADRTYLLVDGAIAACGTHAELLASHPTYRRLFGDADGSARFVASAGFQG